MKLLHINSTPRPVAESNSLGISSAFLDQLTSQEAAVQVETLHLFETDLPGVTGLNIESKYALLRGLPIGPRHAPAWTEIEALITQFLSADAYLITAPMWNFHIPYVLKYYIDAIVQPSYLFAYNEQGVPVGLCQGKRMACITSRGGDYSAGGPMHAFDLQEPYLRSIFGFVGIQDVHFVHAQPMDMGPALREPALAAAAEQAFDLAQRFLHPGAVRASGDLVDISDRSVARSSSG